MKSLLFALVSLTVPGIHDLFRLTVRERCRQEIAFLIINVASLLILP